MKYHAYRFGLAQLFFHSSALLALLAFPLGAFADPQETPGQETHGRVVNCDHGGRLALAVRNARPGDTIRFTGTCKEQVTITTDRLTLDGQNEGIIDGETDSEDCAFGKPVNPEATSGQIEVDAAQGVQLVGFIIKRSPVDGIFFRGSSATLRYVDVRNSCDDGIDSEQAAITLVDSTFEHNGENGMNLSNNSTANIFGDTVAFSNGNRFGVLNHNSLLYVSTDAHLDASNNNYIGIGVFAGGQLISYTGKNTQITVDDNLAQGLLLINSGMFLSYSTMEILRNRVGITLVDGSTFTQTSGTLKIEGNAGVGMAAENSTVSLRQALSEDVAVFEIAGNTPLDLSLTFGARATLEAEGDSVNIDSVYCGEGVLVQGFHCPGE
jgi:hypothetical protein